MIKKTIALLRTFMFAVFAPALNALGVDDYGINNVVGGGTQGGTRG